MKKHVFFGVVLICLIFTACSKNNSNRKNQVIVYTYNSFSGEWGAGPQIAQLFKEKTGLEVIYADCGDSGQILAKVITDKSKPYADVVVGLDNNYAELVQNSGLFLEYAPDDRDLLIDRALTDELNSEGPSFLVPYDYSHFAFIFDTSTSLEPPECLEDLTKEIYKRKIILMDAKTSTVGLGFENWVKSVYEDKADDYMKRLEQSVLTVSPSWSVGYGMFTEGEAPLVISYTTSPAYHIEYGEGDQFKALVFTDGHVRQIEGAGIIKNAPNVEGAKKFIDFLISNEAQKIIPLTQWMYPANQTVELPESYKACSQYFATR